MANAESQQRCAHCGRPIEPGKEVRRGGKVYCCEHCAEKDQRG
ncbi:MAG: hypothetical protein LC776_06390 [Acidobacteria bacterium]|nr:hypothetical protein [Acidobacteriota bacterium]